MMMQNCKINSKTKQNTPTNNSPLHTHTKHRFLQSNNVEIFERNLTKRTSKHVTFANGHCEHIIIYRSHNRGHVCAKMLRAAGCTYMQFFIPLFCADTRVKVRYTIERLRLAYCALCFFLFDSIVVCVEFSIFFLRVSSSWLRSDV